MSLRPTSGRQPSRRSSRKRRGTSRATASRGAAGDPGLPGEPTSVPTGDDMPTLTYPGVYIEEIPSGARPIEAVSTSTAAFVGLAEMGPDEATRVTSWTEFQRSYGYF